MVINSIFEFFISPREPRAFYYFNLNFIRTIKYAIYFAVTNFQMKPAEIKLLFIGRKDFFLVTTQNLHEVFGPDKLIFGLTKEHY